MATNGDAVYRLLVDFYFSSLGFLFGPWALLTLLRRVNVSFGESIAQCCESSESQDSYNIDTPPILK
jgi:hypothetical protein